MADLLQELKDFYNGQDLHIVRNNEELILNEYFKINVAFEISFPDVPFPKENIYG